MVVRKPTFNCFSTSLIFRIIFNFILQKACHIGGGGAFGFNHNPVDKNPYIQSWHMLIRLGKDFLEFLQQSYKLIFHVLGKFYPNLERFFLLAFIS